MNRTIMKRSLPFLVLLAAACTADQANESRMDTTSESGTAASAASAAAQAYDFERPDLTIELHDDLHEISGLTTLPDGRLAAVQDEEGVIFVMNGQTGQIEERRSFGADGDYEGIELVGDRVFVLRSDGSLFESSWSENGSDEREIETPLAGRNDTEGLAYDEGSGRLLIACKEDPGEGINDSQKAIYALDGASGAFDSDPAFLIDADEVEDQASGNGPFRPSALAVHPVDGTLFVLSSNLKVIVVVGPDGAVREVWSLSGRMFEQPEGLAFLPDGTLYVASEGGDGAAMLYAFSPEAGG
jgi:uncharacterized protein YjiK